MPRETIYLPQRGLDHIVPAVQNLDHAAQVWQSLGFTMTPRAMHAWGTSNRLIQLDRFFVEVLEVASPEKLIPPSPRNFSFGSYLADYLKRREGIAMTVFESQDATEDRDQFAERGLPDLEPFYFERQQTLPDGEQKTVAFSLAFAPPEASPDAVFFTCQQHAPQLFWKPQYQTHANTAYAVDEVTMVAADPAAYAPVLEQLQVPEAVS
ncbi:MAG: VOC family protein, partial [Pseudomonadota bacterium]